MCGGSERRAICLRAGIGIRGLSKEHGYLWVRLPPKTKRILIGESGAQPPLGRNGEIPNQSCSLISALKHLSRFLYGPMVEWQTQQAQTLHYILGSNPSWATTGVLLRPNVSFDEYQSVSDSWIPDVDHRG